VSVASIRILIEESPMWPFVLSTPKSACALPPFKPYQALDAPMQWMYWFVTVASTVHVPARRFEATRMKIEKRMLEIPFWLFENKILTSVRGYVVRLNARRVSWPVGQVVPPR
jgi:hypothetical protein